MIVSIDNVPNNAGEIFHDISVTRQIDASVLARDPGNDISHDLLNSTPWYGSGGRIDISRDPSNQRSHIRRTYEICAAQTLVALLGARCDPPSLPNDDPRNLRRIHLLDCSMSLRRQPLRPARSL